MLQYICYNTFVTVHLLQYICYNTFVTVHLLQYICYSTFVTVHMLQYICYSTFVTVHMLQYICYSTFVTVHMLQYICYSTFVTVHLLHRYLLNSVYCELFMEGKVGLCDEYFDMNFKVRRCIYRICSKTWGKYEYGTILVDNTVINFKSVGIYTGYVVT